MHPITLYSFRTTLCIDNVSIGNGRHFNGSIALRYTDKELGGNYVLFTTTLPTMYGKGHQGWLECHLQFVRGTSIYRQTQNPFYIILWWCGVQTHQEVELKENVAYGPLWNRIVIIILRNHEISTQFYWIFNVLLIMMHKHPGHPIARCCLPRTHHGIVSMGNGRHLNTIVLLTRS